MLYNFFAGIVIGSGFILPGVSGGVLALVFGIYEKLVKSVSTFFKNPKENIKFLFPILLGMGVGVVILGNALKFVFNKYYMEACFLFIGLIIGGVPILFKKVNEKGKLNYVLVVISFILSFSLFMLGKNKLDLSSSMNGGIDEFLKMILAGFIFISGKVIPGISSSFMMMLIGMYEYVLDIMAHPITAFTTNILTTLPFMIGMGIGFIVILKLISIALEKQSSNTYSVIIGFVIGSIPAIFPGFDFGFSGIIAVVLLVIGFITSYLFSRTNKKELI